MELALTVPLLADLGSADQILQTAVREGARFSAMAENPLVLSQDPAATKDRIRLRVIDYLDGFSVGLGDLTIDQNYPMTSGGSLVVGSEIVVTYNRSLLILGAPLLPSGKISPTGRSVFRNFLLIPSSVRSISYIGNVMRKLPRAFLPVALV